MFLGVGWGGAITFTYLRTPMMLRHGTFTCTCAHTSCYVEDVSRHAGVGWGGVITFTYILPAHIAKTNLSKRSADILEKPCGFILAPSTRAGVWSETVFPISWHLAQKTNKNWMTSIWTYLRTWQWRWEANVVGKDLLEKTGAYLAKM